MIPEYLAGPLAGLATLVCMGAAAYLGIWLCEWCAERDQEIDDD